ncbi:MAG: SDR family NAD(P)-dependent oxidoreductase, partial [Tistlia sp.]
MKVLAEVKVLAEAGLVGRRGLVTGAGTGIGQAIAVRLAELGMTVVGIGRRDEALKATAALCPPGRFERRPCDLRDAAAVEALVAGLPGDGLDLLVNNAGGQFYAPAEAISRRGWAAVIDLNLTAVFTLIQACRGQLARRRGSVVNLSLSGVERGSKGLAHSIAARAGVLGLTRTLALEWAPEGIRLNCLAPGTVATEAFAGAAGEAELERL